MSKIRDVMTRDPISVNPEASAQAVAQLMRSSHIGPIPVVDREGKLVGIVTDRDLAMKIVADDRRASQTKVADVMSADPHTCSPDDDVDHAIRTMEEHQVRRVPVVDEQSRLIGIVAQADIATKVDRPRKVAEAVEEISHRTVTESR